MTWVPARRQAQPLADPRQARLDLVRSRCGRAGSLPGPASRPCRSRAPCRSRPASRTARPARRARRPARPSAPGARRAAGGDHRTHRVRAGGSDADLEQVEGADVHLAVPASTGCGRRWTPVHQKGASVDRTNAASRGDRPASARRIGKGSGPPRVARGGRLPAGIGGQPLPGVPLPALTCPSKTASGWEQLRVIGPISRSRARRRPGRFLPAARAIDARRHAVGLAEFAPHVGRIREPAGRRDGGDGLAGLPQHPGGHAQAHRARVGLGRLAGVFLEQAPAAAPTCRVSSPTLPPSAPDSGAAP